MKPKLIVFDLDGTLIPSMDGFSDIASDIISRNYGWNQEEARQAYLNTSGIAFFRQLEVLFPKDDRNVTTSTEFESRKKQHFFGQTIPRAVFKALQTLRSEGRLLAVSSNNFDFLVQRYCHEYASNLFHRVLGFRDGFEKGGDHFDFLENDLGVERSEMLFVGDSLSDLQMAKREKVSFVGVTGTFEAKDFHRLDSDSIVLESLATLPSLFTEERWMSLYLRRA